MNYKLESVIRLTAAMIKFICGFMLLNKVPGTQSFLFLISGILLMLAGLIYIVPMVAERIELYIMNKKDPDCGVIISE